MIIYVLAGGVVGTLARWYLQGFVQTASGAGSFPTGTLFVNIVGSLVLGFVARLGTGSTIMSPEMRGGLTIGVCGAFTTMSTFSYESLQLLGEGDYVRAFVYMAGTIIGCLAAVAVGSLAAGRLL